ncbi:hypothetical protein AGMMS49992_23050 [Clostridia bacterium]|nr:hypothetical protein AGMMS49992_23050 [Clostridia bacterium]
MTFWKLLFTGLLVAAAFVLAMLRQAPAYWFAVAALVFSWLGDATLAGFEPLTRMMKEPSLWGLGFFAVAHLCYIVAFTLYLKAWPRDGWRTSVMLAAFAAAGIVLWLLVCWRSSQPVQLRFASLAYSLLLFVMCCLAWACAVRLDGFVWPLALGGVLFVLSDGMIAFEWFRDWRYSWQPIAVWATYAPAQLLLLIGMWMLRTPDVSSVANVIGL